MASPVPISRGPAVAGMETYREKAMRKFKENPWVPLGEQPLQPNASNSNPHNPPSILTRLRSNCRRTDHGHLQAAPRRVAVFQLLAPRARRRPGSHHRRPRRGDVLPASQAGHDGGRGCGEEEDREGGQGEGGV